MKRKAPAADAERRDYFQRIGREGGKKSWEKMTTSEKAIRAYKIGIKGGRPREVDRDKILDLRKGGRTLQETAEALGCSVATVSRAQVGICKLCLRERNLQLSHLVPASILAVMSEPSLQNPHPVRLAGRFALQKPTQVKDYVLCYECEQRFNRNGEGWFAPVVARMGSFPLRDTLKGLRPLKQDADSALFSGLTIPGFDIGKLEYFALSIFWRAAAHKWRDRDPVPQIDLGIYQEPIRQFLHGEAEYPKDVVLLAGIWPVEPVPIGVYLPVTESATGFDLFRFYMAGFEFALCIGERVPPDVKQLCCHTSSQRIVIVSKKPNYHAANRFKQGVGGASMSQGLKKLLQGPNPRKS